jgi:hypothetical protein
MELFVVWRLLHLVGFNLESLRVQIGWKAAGMGGRKVASHADGRGLVAGVCLKV